MYNYSLTKRDTDKSALNMRRLQSSALEYVIYIVREEEDEQMSSKKETNY